MNTKIPNIFFKEEELEDLYQNNSEKIRVPTNQTQYSFETKENLQKFIDNQFPTKLEKSKYKEYRNEWHRRAKNFDPGPAPLAVCIELVSTNVLYYYKKFSRFSYRCSKNVTLENRYINN